MKQGFRLLCFVVIVALALSARFVAHAQSQSSTVDPFVAQITSSRLNSVAPAGVNSYVNDISGNGRFAVIESNGDIATQNPDNADGNREIFLFDYAQRRIYQITHTRSARNDATRPFLNSSNQPDPTNIRVEVNNVKPVISAQPVVTSNNQLIYSIVFSSNATTPANFDGDANSAALALDGNQEIWIYQLPPVSDVSLASGDDAPVDLSAGTFIRVTDTPASRRPQAGSATATPSVADDNRDVAINDDASIIAFASTRNNPTGRATSNGATNTDGNPEIFVFNRNANAATQVTVTQGDFVFNDNPSLSADGSVLAFISNANITGNNNDDGRGNGNAEIYYARLNASNGIVTAPTQATSTRAATPGLTVNILSPGRRLSRDGRFIAFESTASDPKANGAIQVSTAVFVYDIAGNSFQQYGPRAALAGTEVFRFPVFTDYVNSDGTASLTPRTLVFASRLSFRADGSAPTNPTDADSLNPNSLTQLFSVPLAAPTTFTRITNTPAPIMNAFTLLQPFVSDTRRRIAFNIANTELGGGNADGSSEAFYLLTPPAETSNTQGISFFTGASERPVTTGAAAPAVVGLAPGMLAIARSTNTLAASSKDASGASESQRSPSLPIELNGVSIAVNGAAAGLYSIRPNQLNFVVPAGLAATTGTATYPVVINNNGNLIRGTLQIVPAQPDIFTSTNGDGGRARAFLPNTMIGEPFTVSTAGDTLIAIFLTGVRNVMRSQVRVTIGSTDISGDSLICSANPTASATTLPCFNLDAPGMDQINVRLPGTLANAGDVPVIVTVTIGGQTFTSRPADTAPRILLR